MAAAVGPLAVAAVALERYAPGTAGVGQTGEILAAVRAFL
jgi:hypothetical protein